MSTRKKASQHSEKRQVSLFQAAEIPNPYRKAVEVVHSQPKAPMSMLQRKLSNVWLKNAIQTQPDEDGWWTIGVSAMKNDIDFDSRNTHYLAESARELMSMIFEWDVYGKENTRFKASVLFPEVEITTSEIRYQISSQMRKQVLNPAMFAIVDLTMIKKLKRGGSIAIYENCVRFVNTGMTTPVEWGRFRDMILGATAGGSTYDEYKYFKAKVLKLCIAEVNSQTDITIELIEHKRGRSVQNIQFKVSRKEMGEENPVDEDVMQMIGELVNLGVPQSESRRMVRQYSLEDLDSALKYTQKKIIEKSRKGDPITTPGAYYRRALQGKWALTVEDALEKKTVKKQDFSSSSTTSESSLEEAFASRRRQEAQLYFQELDLPEQDDFISRYNMSQPVLPLQIKQKKNGKGAEIVFLNWIASETWGEPSKDDILAFAKEMFGSR
jgi:hypothetical protein